MLIARVADLKPITPNNSKIYSLIIVDIAGLIPLADHASDILQEVLFSQNGWKCYPFQGFR
jgi:hypothetical protein